MKMLAGDLSNLDRMIFAVMMQIALICFFMLNEDSVKEFKSNLRGSVIEPGDKSYDDARKVYNGMIHKRPRLITRCADVADVIGSVNFARENELLLAIRSGGHNAGGLGICDDGLVIDLAPMKYTRVDPAARTVTV